MNSSQEGNFETLKHGSMGRWTGALNEKYNSYFAINVIRGRTNDQIKATFSFRSMYSVVKLSISPKMLKWWSFKPNSCRLVAHQSKSWVCSGMRADDTICVTALDDPDPGCDGSARWTGVRARDTSITDDAQINPLTQGSICLQHIIITLTKTGLLW